MMEPNIIIKTLLNIKKQDQPTRVKSVAQRKIVKPDSNVVVYPKRYHLSLVLHM